MLIINIYYYSDINLELNMICLHKYPFIHSVEYIIRFHMFSNINILLNKFVLIYLTISFIPLNSYSKQGDIK